MISVSTWGWAVLLLINNCGFTWITIAILYPPLPWTQELEFPMPFHSKYSNSPVHRLVFAITGRKEAKPRPACLVGRHPELCFALPLPSANFGPLLTNTLIKRTKQKHKNKNKTLFLKSALLLRLPKTCGSPSGLFSFLPSTISDFVPCTFHISHTGDSTRGTLKCDAGVPSKTSRVSRQLLSSRYRCK